MFEKKLELMQYRRMLARAQGAMDAGNLGLAAQYFEYAGIMHDALQQKLGKIEDRRIRELMVYRYLHGLTWTEIAERMYFTERWVMKLHKRGLELL